MVSHAVDGDRRVERRGELAVLDHGVVDVVGDEIDERESEGLQDVSAYTH